MNLSSACLLALTVLSHLVSHITVWVLVNHNTASYSAGRLPHSSLIFGYLFLRLPLAPADMYPSPFLLHTDSLLQNPCDWHHHSFLLAGCFLPLSNQHILYILSRMVPSEYDPACSYHCHSNSSPLRLSNRSLDPSEGAL